MELPALRGGVLDLAEAADPAWVAAALAQPEEAAVSVGAEGNEVPRLRRITPDPGRWHRTGTWVLSGGLGALGRHTARWLARGGAERLVFLGRTAAAAPSEAAAALLAELADLGVQLDRKSVDISDAAAVSAALEGLTEPFGFVHAAGVTHPGSVADISDATIAAILAPKVGGARTLDQLVKQERVHTAILFSSIAAVWGSRDLSAYAAANAYLDSAAKRWSGLGVHALSVAWGPWGEGGMVDEDHAKLLARMGQKMLQPKRALAALDRLLCSGADHGVVARVDWAVFAPLYQAAGPRALVSELAPQAAARDPELPLVAGPSDEGPRDDAWYTEQITVAARAVLGLESGPPHEQPLLELGLDSLMATELKNALLQRGVDLPLGRLLGGPSVEELVIMANARAQGDPARPKGEIAEADDLPQLLVWTHLAASIVGAAIAAGIAVLLSRLAG
jgi:NAD(P)-dependent dehydrogenase (short-subunit alcohol dehydrogenase family)/aryl carrier-like protein